MRPKFNKKYINIGIVAFLVIVCSILFFFLIFQMSDFTTSIGKLMNILRPFIYGFIIAYILSPIIDNIERKIFYPIYLDKHDSISYKRKKVYRVISMLLSFTLIIILFVILIKSIIPQLTESIKSLSKQFPYYYDSFQMWLDKLVKDNQNIFKIAEDYLDEYSTDLKQYFNDKIFPTIKDSVFNFSTILISVVTNLWNFVIGIIVSIYLLLNKETFCAQTKKITYALFSRERANLIIKDTRFISDTFIGFLGGKIIDSIIIFILCLIGCSILNIPYAILISVIVGVTNIIPFFGPFIGAIPSAFLILMVDPIKCIYFIIFVLILQQLDGNVIGPLILGDSTGLSGFWVIFAITVFGGLWGVLGMIIGIPIFAVIYALCKRNVERKLKSKELPINTNVYRKIKSIDENGKYIELFEANDLNFKREKKNVKERKEEVINIIKNNKNKDEESE